MIKRKKQMGNIVSKRTEKANKTYRKEEATKIEGKKDL